MKWIGVLGLKTGIFWKRLDTWGSGNLGENGVKCFVGKGLGGKREIGKN